MKLVFVLCRSFSGGSGTVVPAAVVRFSCKRYATYANDDALLQVALRLCVSYALRWRCCVKHASSYIKRDAGITPLSLVVLPSKGDEKKE